MSALLVSLLLAATPSLPGARLVGEQLEHGLSGSKVGQWVTYRFDGGGDRVHYWRVAVVGEQTDGKGRPAVWLELDVGEHPAMRAPISQMKLLVARAVGLGGDGVTRALVAFGVERPVEVDPGSLEVVRAEATATPSGSGEGPAAFDRADVTSRRGAPTRLVTAAGTVTAWPLEITVRKTLIKRVWVSEQVPILNVARVELPTIAHSMEVRDYGIDARAMMATPDPTAAKIKIEPYNANP